MYEATFRIADAGGVGSLTADGETRVELWCNDHCDLLSVTGASETLYDRLADEFDLRESVRRGDGLVAVTASCLRESDATAVDPYLERHDCLLVAPLRYVDGAKVCRVLALDAGDLSACYRELLDDGFRVTVEHKRAGAVTPGSPLGVDELLPDLTPRQRQAFVTAHEQGYYEIPRKTTTEAVAAALGVERRTAEEHLRRAENKLAAALVAYLR
jgi:predicted DNA binding protein